MPLAGGFACFAEDGSPLNKVVGLGFGGVPEPGALDDLEQTFSALGADVQVELSTLGDPDVAAALSGRGYRLVGFENVLGCPLPVDGQPLGQSAIDIRRGGPDDVDVFVDAVVEGFAHPDGVGVVSHEEFPREIVDRAVRDIEKTGVATYLAELEGAVAGGGSVRFIGGIAQLTGAATVPAFRRRGVQTALLDARLRDAAAAGCDIGVVTTAPGSTSQKNVQRRGFHLLYTRAVLVKS